MPQWLLRFDGLYEPRFSKRGAATYGFVVERDGEVVHEGRGIVAQPGPPAPPPAPGAPPPLHWPNAGVAEFGALVRGLEWVRDHKPADDPLEILGDSRLVVETVAGRWKLSSPSLRPLYDLARQLLRDAGGGTLRKISREENARADALSRQAYHEAVAAHPEWGLGGDRRKAA